jgi:hypothetical protein
VRKIRKIGLIHGAEKDPLGFGEVKDPRCEGVVTRRQDGEPHAVEIRVLERPLSELDARGVTKEKERFRRPLGDDPDDRAAFEECRGSTLQLPPGLAGTDEEAAPPRQAKPDRKDFRSHFSALHRRWVSSRT